MSNAGRPTDFKEEYIEQAVFLCKKFGAIDKDLAEYFNVSTRTITRWKDAFPRFSLALKEAKTECDKRVERALYEKAIGYSHPEDKIFNNNGEEMVVETTKHYPPDTAAMIIWLGNRQPDKWKKDPSGSTNATTTVVIKDMTGKADIEDD